MFRTAFRTSPVHMPLPSGVPVAENFSLTHQLPFDSITIPTDRSVRYSLYPYRY
jgi:hypothetical protein